MEGREHHPLGGALGSDQRRELRLDDAEVAGALDLDVQGDAIAELRQHVGEPRDALAAELGGEPRAGIEPRELGRRTITDRAAPVGSALEGLVVDHDQLAVGRELTIELDGLGPEIERRREGRMRILGSASRRAAMGDAEEAHGGVD